MVSLSIVQKLVAAFIGLTLIVLVATLGLARWSFQQGFLDYVNALEQVRLERIQSRLAMDYLAADRQWDFVTDAYLGDMLRPRMRSANSGAQQSAAGFQGRPGRGDRRPLPRDRSMETNEPRGASPQGPNARGPNRGPFATPIDKAGSFAPPTALFNNKGEQVAGFEFEGDTTFLIRVPVIADGKQVGELRSDPRRQIDEPLETAFSKRQFTTSWIIGLTSLGLALAVSLLLARGLSAPVKRMISGVGKLSAGDYSSRMEEQRKDELGQLTRDIDHLGMTLEKAQSARTRLLADVSHELRTPLTVLNGEIEALKDGMRPFDATQLESLDQEVQRLRYLVNDLYELSLSDAGGLRYEFHSINVRDALHSAVAHVQARAVDAGLTLSIAADAGSAITVWGDKRRLDQLFSNILENAIAYSDAPGTIDIHISTGEDHAVLRFDDSPPGATQAECDRLFEPLYRKDSSRARRSGGAGLGLAICRNIAIAHRGTIAATPSVLGGVSIVLKIPLAQENRR